MKVPLIHALILLTSSFFCRLPSFPHQQIAGQLMVPLLLQKTFSLDKDSVEAVCSWVRTHWAKLVMVTLRKTSVLIRSNTLWVFMCMDTVGSRTRPDRIRVCLCACVCEFLTSSHQPLGRPLILSKNDKYNRTVMLMKTDRERARARKRQRGKDKGEI